MNQKHMDLISLQTQPFQNSGKEKTCLCQNTSWGFPAKFKMMEKHMEPSAKPSGCALQLSYRETQSNGKFLPQKWTAFRRHVCQPVCGLQLIKPGLRMAAEHATSMFLKRVQGAIHMGLCVWSSFTAENPHIILLMPL